MTNYYVIKNRFYRIIFLSVFSTILLIMLVALFFNPPVVEYLNFIIAFILIYLFTGIFWLKNPISINIKDDNIEKVYLNIFNFEEKIIYISLFKIDLFHFFCGSDSYGNLLAGMRLFYKQNNRKVKSVIPWGQLITEEFIQKIVNFKKYNSKYLLECNQKWKQEIDQELSKENISLSSLNIKFQENNMNLVNND